MMVGGFLGAGKTTAVLVIGKLLKEKGLSVGLITNDQSIGLVDTALLRSQGFATEEISGGCFCCRFNSLVQASENLSTEDRPLIFIAEPVGSCTDLRATVSYPLQRIYGDQFLVAPLSVVIDPIRLRRILGLESGKTFSPKVLYIYSKQLEEADILVINKCDLLSGEELAQLEAVLKERYPEKSIMRITARTGEGVEAWLDVLLENEAGQHDAMLVDYDEYADGEAKLGWMNWSGLVAGDEFDGNALLTSLAGRIRESLKTQSIEIAHLKMTMMPDSGPDLAAGNLVQTEAKFELTYELAEPLDEGTLIINLRAEGAPDVLQDVITAVIQDQMAASNLECTVHHLEAFRPGRPVPTHRYTDTTL